MEKKLLFIVFCVAQMINAQGFECDRLKELQCYDSTLNKMALRDAKSIERALNTKKNIIDPHDCETELVPSNKKQVLSLVFLPGDVINQFSQFKVEYNENNLDSEIVFKSEEFCTGKGIKLGLKSQKLIEILGQPTKINEQNQISLYLYRPDSSLYFGNYYFEEDKLIKLWFGFEYP
ncbi:hypothetical protein DMA11_19180 [Marinilabiliaceae bacterium JC017]|nr:hypothetical protein DMA11_19180 [Marinilabiliaceae bacterium JC017]